MKSLLSRTNGALLAASIGAATLLSACQQDPSSPTGSQQFALKIGTTGTTSAAHPAIAYRNNVQVKQQGVTYTYNTIGVMDTDGTHQTNLVTAASNSTVESFQSPSWNAAGSSIAYLDKPSLTATAIKAFDVSVNSSGAAVASNARTIYAPATSDSAYVQSGPAWSATSSTCKIAFTRNHTGSKLGLAELCTISQSGGTVTVLTSYSRLNAQGTVISHYMFPTWSPDDSKIAVTREDTIGHGTIMIFDASTGAALDSIPISATNVTGLEWSRTGANLLSFMESTGGSTVLYYCAPTTGATPATNSVSAASATWSPNNSSLMYVTLAGTYPLAKLTAQSSSSTTLATGFGGSALNWKR